jgi:hypothetical protein
MSVDMGAEHAEGAVREISRNGINPIERRSMPD